MVIRKFEVLRALWGATLLIAPRWILTDIHHVTVDTKSVVVARILGARHLTQAVLSGVSPSPEVLAVGLWVDAAHAGTAIALAVADRSRAQAGIIDAAIAAAFAGLGYRHLSTLRASSAATTAAHHRRDALARAVLHCLPGGPALMRTTTTRDHISAVPAP